MTSKFNIAIVGEAFGEEEDQWKKPFIGKAGQQLNDLLADAGISRDEVFTTNVFNLRPEHNKLETLCVKKADGGFIPRLDPLLPALYLKSEYQGELDRLYNELREVRPNLVVLLGNTACWAVLGQSGISKIRGTCALSPKLPNQKCLPTYPPAAVLRQYDLRHVTVLDLLKAKRESSFPELRRPVRKIEIAESLSDIRSYMDNWLRSADYIAFDIETDRREQITCIGFAASIDKALVIPITDPRKTTGSYWATLQEEVAVWKLVAEILALPKPKKLGQNTLYDIQYLWMKYGIPVVNYAEDTMLLHHSLLPESEKGLGFLGSVYTDEPAWKAERPRGDHSIKKEE